MTTEIRLSMQRAIAKKRSFFTWWQEQEFFDKKALRTKDTALIEYQTQEEILSADLIRFKQLIVTDTRGCPPEKFQFVLHTSAEEAAKHGQRTLGKRRFRILPFSQFKRTPAFRRMSNLIALKNKWALHKKPTP